MLTLMLCVFGITTGEFVIAGILPDVAADLAVSIPAAGLLVTAYALGMIVGGPVLTALTARFPRKPLITALLGVAVAGNLASTLAPGYPVLFAARVISACVVATFFANAIVVAAASAPPDRQASTVAKLALGMNLAMILGAPLGTAIGHALGWRATFAAITAVCLAGLVLVWRLVPIGLPERPNQRAEVTESGLGVRSELRVFGERDVRLAIALTAVGNAGLLAVFTYLAPLLTGVAGFPAEAVAGLLLVYGVGAALGNLAGGWLYDRAPSASMPGLLALLTAVLAVAWLVGRHPVPAAVTVFLLGAVGFAVIPGMQARVLSAAAEAPTLAIAVNASAYQVAAAFAGWLGGRVIDAAGVRPIYLVAAAVTAAGFMLAVYSGRRTRTPAR
ncbi:MFS transporter [Pseudonocardia eucalypti]|uniref:MFS transporter n=1 Tax=Pseudonocardia eucalypti TaxID=648755 RepID=A0ABP9Q9R9_9PSEU